MFLFRNKNYFFIHICNLCRWFNVCPCLWNGGVYEDMMPVICWKLLLFIASLKKYVIFIALQDNYTLIYYDKHL